MLYINVRVYRMQLATRTLISSLSLLKATHVIIFLILP